LLSKQVFTPAAGLFWDEKVGWVGLYYTGIGMKKWGVGLLILHRWDEMVGVGMKGMKGMN
jgi:hypothetical protein